jgi:hypothetical protein
LNRSERKRESEREARSEQGSLHDGRHVLHFLVLLLI